MEKKGGQRERKSNINAADSTLFHQHSDTYVDRTQRRTRVYASLRAQVQADDAKRKWLASDSRRKRSTIF